MESTPENQLPILGFLSPVVAQAIGDHVFTKPELFCLDEHALMKKSIADSMGPSPTDNRLRLRFWMKFDEAVSKGHVSMDLGPVFAGICTKVYFYNHYLKNPYKVAWLMCVPTGYGVKTEEALEFGIDQLRDILNIPHVGVNGKLDARLAAIKVKIVEMLDVRVKGAPIQRNLNITASATPQQIANETADLTMDQLHKQLSEMRRRERQSRNLPEDKPETKDVVAE